MNALWHKPIEILYVAVSHIMAAGEEYYLQVVDDINCLSCEVMAQVGGHQVPIEKYLCLSPLQAMKLYIKDHIQGKIEWWVTDYEVNISLLWSEGIIWHDRENTKFVDMEVTE